MTTETFPNLRAMAETGRFYDFDASQQELRSLLAEYDRLTGPQVSDIEEGSEFDGPLCI